jgi:APA family basic amino acid/polyamine antiporter
MTRTLERSLVLRDLVFIVLGTIIGSGIFLVPSTVLRQTGGAIGPALLVWVTGGVLSFLGAMTYAEMGAMRPEAGGLYSYMREAFGPLPAFLYGWTMFFVIGSGSVATLAVAFSGYLGQLIPVSPVGAKVAAVLMILAILLINVRGTRQSANVQNVSTALKAGAIVVLSVIMLFIGRGYTASGNTMWPATLDTSLLSGIGAAMIGVLWAYEGWQYATFSAGETRDAQRTFPRGIVFGTGLIIVIYLLANLGYIAALGAERAAGSDRIAAEATGELFGPTAGKIIALVILISMFSAANGLTLTAPRLYYSMSRDGVFFAKLAEVHPRFRTPAFAITVSSLWGMLLALSGTFEQLLTYVVVVGWVFYGLGAMAIFTYRRRFPRETRPFRVPGYPITPILFVLSAAAIVVNAIFTQPRTVLVGLAFVLLGIPAFVIWRARRIRQPS